MIESLSEGRCLPRRAAPPYDLVPRKPHMVVKDTWNKQHVNTNAAILREHFMTPQMSIRQGFPFAGAGWAGSRLVIVFLRFKRAKSEH